MVDVLMITLKIVGRNKIRSTPTIKIIVVTITFSNFEENTIPRLVIKEEIINVYSISANDALYSATTIVVSRCKNSTKPAGSAASKAKLIIIPYNTILKNFPIIIWDLLTGLESTSKKVPFETSLEMQPAERYIVYSKKGNPHIQR